MNIIRGFGERGKNDWFLDAGITAFVTVIIFPVMMAVVMNFGIIPTFFLSFGFGWLISKIPPLMLWVGHILMAASLVGGYCYGIYLTLGHLDLTTVVTTLLIGVGFFIGRERE